MNNVAKRGGQSSLQIIDKNIADLKEYGNNPRNNDNAVKAVAESIKQFGFKVPIIIDSDNVIVAGHTRLKAAKSLELEQVPCIIVDDLTPEQIKAFRLADNKVSELAEWNFEKLEIELAALSDLDMSAFGFDESDFNLELEDKEVVEDEVPEVDDENEPTVKRGQVWKLGNHYLMCGDATSREDIEKLLSADFCGGGVMIKQVDLVITDPPYNVAYQGCTKDKLTIMNDAMSDEEFHAFLTKAFECMKEALKDGGAFYVWYASREHINFESVLNALDLQVRQQLIWVKNSIVLGRQDYHWKHEPCLYGWKAGAAHYFIDERTHSTVLEFNKPVRNGEHPTMKPLALIGYLIRNSSKPNDIVLDIFGGSGSTLIACEQLGRQCYTMELDPKYCDVIIKRWEQLTGEKAVLINR